MSPYFRLMKYLKPHWKMAISVSIVILVSAPVSVITIHMSRLIVNGVVYGEIRNVSRLLLLVAVYGLSETLLGFLAYLQDYLKARLGGAIIVDLKAHIMQHVLCLPLAFFDDRSTGEVKERIVDEVEGLDAGLVEPTVNLCNLIIQLIWAIACALEISITLTILYLCIMPLRVFTTKLFVRRAVSLVEVIREQTAKFAGYVIDLLNGVREIKTYTHEEEEARRYRKEAEKIYRLKLREAHNRSMQNPVITFLGGTLGMLIIYLAGGLMVMKQQILIGDLYAFISYTGMIFGPFHMFGFYYNIIRQDLVTAKRVFQILDMSTESAKSKEKRPIRITTNGHISFENVSFAYSPDREALHDITFEAYPGQIVALVGKSGSGKTTITKLICRFYDVDRGRITLDGIDIREMDIYDLRSNIAMVFQEPFLFNGTVRENIAYGRLNATDAEIEKAAAAARADNFILKLPQKYETRVGERGMQLSGGERQRIAIARAILKDPKILILDEATSFVDSEDSLVIQQALDELMKHRTCIIIAHRLETVLRAHNIVVMENGKIVEMGRHQELLENAGVYSRLYLSQFGSVHAGE